MPVKQGSCFKTGDYYAEIETKHGKRKIWQFPNRSHLEHVNRPQFVQRASQPIRLATRLWRGLRLRCPSCGQARVFHGWFSTCARCPACGRSINRAPGYFLGSIFFNYGVTAVLVVATYFGLYFSETLTGTPLLVSLTAFIGLFPLWFFRYARSLWLALDEALDPWPNEEERARGEKATTDT